MVKQRRRIRRRPVDEELDVMDEEEQEDEEPVRQPVSKKRQPKRIVDEDDDVDELIDAFEDDDEDDDEDDYEDVDYDDDEEDEDDTPPSKAIKRRVIPPPKREIKPKPMPKAKSGDVAKPKPRPEPEPEEEEEVQQEKTVSVKKADSTVVDMFFEQVLESLEDGKSVVITKTGDGKWELSMAGKRDPVVTTKKLRGKEYWNEVLTPEYQEFAEEWQGLTYVEKRKKAKKAGAKWEEHDDERIDLIRIVDALLKKEGIEKYKEEYRSRLARAAVKA
jgi:hypothetical protein